MNNIESIFAEAFTFGEREVGLTHPDTTAHIRLRDNGDIEIFADEGIGFVFHKDTKKLVIVADSVQFLVKDLGVSINDKILNTRAKKFTDAVFIPKTLSPNAGLYNFIDHYTHGSEVDDKIFDAKTQSWVTKDRYTEIYGKPPVWNGSSYD